MLKNTLKYFLCLISAVSLVSCSQTNGSSATDNVCTRDVFAMDTYMSMKAYGDNAETALSKAENLIVRLENELSVTNPESCISKLNSANGSVVEVSRSAADIIKKAVEIGNATNGALDITIYPLLKEWGFTTENYKIPDKDTIARLLDKTGYKDIILDDLNVTIPEDYCIDLGALAKGYTSDKIMDTMKENGVGCGIVSLGGNVQAIGSKPDGSLWKVAVRDPFSPDTDMCILEIADKAVITSGNYERFFIGDDGMQYFHIIDPSDGFPADNGLVSVTVIGESGLE